MSGLSFGGAPLDSFLAAASVPRQDRAILERQRRPRDLGVLLHDAWRHGVDAAVEENLWTCGETGAGGRPARDAAIHAFLRWEQQTVRVAAVLDSAGIPPGLLLKGGALRYQVYPEPWFRAAADLDILLPQESLEPAVAALVRGGAAVHVPVPERGWSMRHGHHVTLWQDGFHVELHRAVDQNDRPGLRYHALAAGAGPISGVSAPLLAPNVSDQLLVAAAHALKHALNIPLKSLVDVHLAVGHGAVADADALIRRARAEDLDGVLWLLLSACTELFGTSMDPGALAALQPRPARLGVVRAVLSSRREGFFPPQLGADTLLRRLAAHVLLVRDPAFVARVGMGFVSRRLRDLAGRS